MRNFLKYKKRVEDYDFHIEDLSENTNAPDIEKMEKVDKSLDKNLKYAKQVFHMPLNSDIIFRNFDITMDEKVFKAFLIVCDGLANTESINECVLKPFMYLRHIHNENDEKLEDFIERKLLPQRQVTKSEDINDILKKVNFGFCVLFVDTVSKGFIIDLKGWEHRGVDTPQNESIILGPHEAFNEMLRTNTALIRKTINSPDLIMEMETLGKVSKTPASVAYIKGIVNENLLKEVKYRIENIDVDYILTALDLEQYIEDDTFALVPQILSTERPDRVCNALIQGKIAIVVSGSPNVLVLPSTFFDFLKTADDEYLRYPFNLVSRTLRFTAVFLSLFASAIFIAIVNYHEGLLLTDILFSIEASRTLVPFPSILELILMEGAFELIKEAGSRIPSAIGQTLGIVGGLVLGQAAVAASVVSPIMIIVVATGGIASFAIPDYSLSLSFRISRFLYIFGAAIAGFLGILAILFIRLLFLFNVKSFGVPYFVPIAPITKDSSFEAFFTFPVWKREARPGYVKSQNAKKQAKISRVWRYKKDR
ncbi:MAG: spore germination protein [Ruminococcaceae bacterium]|nr:spore germination protein [Oscillospiraceae bacterium]